MTRRLRPRRRPFSPRPLDILLACAILVTGGCEQRPPVGGDSPTDDPTSITIHYEMDERVFSPAHWRSYRNLVFATLVRWDENGEMQGWLADRWEHSDDYRTWTYHLRENARWHDGVPVTTADIEFTLGLLSNPELLILDPGDFELTVRDEHTFTVTAETPTAMGFMQWEVICFPKHLLEDLDPTEYYDWDWWIEPVGNGPFRYVTHLPKTFTELEADPDYFLDRPRVDRIRIRYGGNPLVELMSGNVDMYLGASLVEAQRLERDPRFDEHPGDARGYWAVFWNQNRPQFRDATTRKALTVAIDRRVLFDALNVPAGIPILDAPFIPRGGEEAPEAIPHDPAAARRLLAEAGWEDVDGDGVLERDGQDFRFEALAFAGGADGAVLVQDYLGRVGVDMSILTMDMGVVRNRMRSGEFDAGIFRTGRGYLDAYLFGSNDILGVREAGLASPVGYSNAIALSAREAAARSFDPAAEAGARDVLWSEFQRDVPVTYLHPEVDVLVTNRRIRGVQQGRQLMPWMDRLWVEEGGRLPSGAS